MIHDCNMIEWWSMKPNTAHYNWHYDRPEVNGAVCERAHIERNLYQYKRKHGSLEGYTPKERAPKQGKLRLGYRHSLGVKRNPDDILPSQYDCDEALTPRTSHQNWHYKREQEPCQASRIENAWARSGHSKEELRARNNIDDERIRTLYQITFIDGDKYYGQTWKTLDARLDGHLRNPYNIGKKLRSGIPYLMEKLCEVPNKKMADELEMLMIKSGNPNGRILNVIHNQ